MQNFEASNTSEQSANFQSNKQDTGLGVDIVDIARMQAILARTPSFARRVFSCEECCYCESTAMPHAHFATRFAAKEAVLKALGTGFSKGITPRNIEVCRNTKGKPYIVLFGKAKEVAKNLGVKEIAISLSYTHTEAVACAMAITENSAVKKQETETPMEKLAKQFKQARSILDDLDAPAPDEGGKTNNTGANATASSENKRATQPQNKLVQ